ncbi:MAG: hypothetical protein Q9168_007126 [Polycauliona sp. 1 TL-2023]
MEWGQWPGFEGDGIYVIFNYESRECLIFDGHDGLVSTSPYTPYNSAQLWRITKWSEGEVYAIENVCCRVFIESQGYDCAVVVENAENPSRAGEHGVYLPPRWCSEALWVIDKGMCALEMGRMVVFRSLTNSGYVFTLEDDVTKVLLLLQESLEDPIGERQKWLLHKQPE